MTKKPLIFGEVLFDEFPDGNSILGGAPFNVAWHLQGFGLQPCLISAIGDDALGKQVLQTMEQWGMDTSGVQVLTGEATGRVSISLQQGQPSFDILDHQAYDAISIDNQLLSSTSEFAVLYHGSLAARHAVSRTTLQTYIRQLHVPVFIDINLRPPWWQRSLIESLAGTGTWLKINEHELAAWHGRDSLPREQWLPQARELIQRYGLELLILTQGEAGASYITAEQEISGAPPPVTRMLDTVGAGDAFSAVTLAGLLLNWPRELTLQRALAFSSRLCAIRGATTLDTALYSETLGSW